MIRSRKKSVNPRHHTLIQRVNRSDGKAVEICRGAAEWEKRRAECCALADSVCRVCLSFAPLHDVHEPGTETIKYRAGHVHHIDRRGLGGGKRNDALSNLKWLCPACHAKAHQQGITAEVRP